MPIALAAGIHSHAKLPRPSSKPVVPKPPRDADGIKNRAGCVVLSDCKKKILLISSNGHQGKWILPAGTLEHGEVPEDGAIRETLEEAGVVGEVQEKIGTFVDGKKNRTHYYSLLTKKIVDDYDECGFRKRSWFPIRDAEKELLWRPAQHQVLMTWLSRHNNLYSRGTSTSPGAGVVGEKTAIAAEISNEHENKRLLDEEERNQIAVEVKTGAS